MELKSGATLGRYRLEGPIGAGGMGVVWRATDTTLGRAVAIKLLPEHFGDDPERVARFEREARVLASLAHPNIAGIYGVESLNDHRFLVLEMVEGETLAVRTTGRRLPTADALAIGLQVARALEAAHERGIVHRDLKPENVQVDTAGNVKLLDFGIARAFADPQLAATRLTAEQTVIGTPAYMSPEQTQGRPVDRRADIWAFGVVLFEILSGRRLFDGTSSAETFAQVLSRPIPWDRLPADLPPAARVLLERCLERDPRQRLQDIGEARIALERALAAPGDRTASASVVAGSERAPRRTAFPWRIVFGSALAGILVAAGLGVWLAGNRPNKPPSSDTLRRFRLPAPPGAAISHPRLAPDGSAIAYVSGGALWLHRLDRTEPRELDRAQNVVDLFWSPDSRGLAYLANRQLVRIEIPDGERRVVANVAGDLPLGSGGVWREDGSFFVTRGHPDGVLSIAAAGSAATTFAAPDSSESDFHDLSLLPEGRGLLTASHRQGGTTDRIVVLRGRERRVVFELRGVALANPVYSPTGHLLFEHETGARGVYALPFSLANLRATGAPFLVSANATSPSVSRGGDLALLETVSGALQFAWVDRSGAVTDTAGSPIAALGVFDLSRDGTQLVTPVVEETEKDLWVLDLTRHTWRRLTFDADFETLPMWSPSGARVAYMSGSSERPHPLEWKIIVRSADGAGAPDTVLRGGYGSPGFTPDERSLTVADFTDTLGWSIRLLDLDRRDRGIEFPAEGQFAIHTRPSPDGRYVVYMNAGDGDPGKAQVFLRRIPPAPGFWQVSTDGGLWPVWNRRGDRVYYVRGLDVMEAEVELGETPRIGTPRKLFTREPVHTRLPFGWTPMVMERDGRFLILRAANTPGREALELWENWTTLAPGRRSPEFR